MRKSRVKGRLVLVTVLILIPLGLGCAWLYWMSPLPFGYRDSPVQFGDSVTWQGGVVSNWDYSYAPGNYENYIEWRGPDGGRRRLARVGDAEASLKKLPDGRLQAEFVDETTIRLARPKRITSTWKDKDTTPVRIESVGD
jgi:hypothetical protein